jgi:short-subunit dehydrogenase
MKSESSILITGATAGIGRALALHLARRGFRVFATGRNLDELASLAREASSPVLETLPLDVTDRASISAAAREVLKRTDGRGIDVLVNNAGYGLSGPLEELDDAAVKRQFDVNVFGLLAVTRAFLPPMRERRSGRVLNIASVLGHMTIPFLGAYCATKYSVEALTDALRLELAPFGVHAVLIEPGTIRSGFEERAMGSFGAEWNRSAYGPFVETAAKSIRASYRLAGGPEHVARAVERAVRARRPRARYRTPFRWRILLALFRAMPTQLADWMLRVSAGLVPNRLPAPAAETARLP